MRRIVAVWLALALAACSSAPPSAPRAFDLGIEAPAVAFRGVEVGAVRGIPPFDGTDMYYRLAWRNASELASFTASVWAAAPSELLRKQLLRATREGVGKCTLEVEIQEFTQVFSAKEASEARLELRAWLSSSNRRVAARGWSFSEPNAGPDAASGAAAFARVTNRMIGEIGAWVAAQPDCR